MTFHPELRIIDMGNENVRELDEVIRKSLFLNKIDQEDVFHFEIMFQIVVLYDQYHDTRVLSFLERLPGEVLNKLSMIQLLEDQLNLYWTSNDIPEEFRKDNRIRFIYEDGSSDLWHIQKSKSIYDFAKVKERMLMQIALN